MLYTALNIKPKGVDMNNDIDKREALDANNTNWKRVLLAVALIVWSFGKNEGADFAGKLNWDKKQQQQR